jgi:hypothetical protein
LGQASSIKGVYNVREQHLEMNKQFVAQKAEEKKKADKSKVQESEAENRIEIKSYDEKKSKKRQKDQSEDKNRDNTDEECGPFEGNLIDIKV